jgi:hypothetical protein
MPRLRRLRTGGDPVTVNPAESETARTACIQVNALAADLTRRGFTVMVRDNGTLTPQVGSQAARDSCEHITVAADDNGTWRFWWSWGDPIASIADVEAAAFKIAYVLTPQSGG